MCSNSAARPDAKDLLLDVLDLRLDKKIRQKSHTAEIFIDITNVYAAVTGDFVFYSYDYSEELTFQSFPSINVGVRVEF